MLLSPCPFFTFPFAFLPLSSRLCVSLESPWVPYHSFPVLLSSALYTVSVNSAVCQRLKVLCKRTLPLSWMYLYSWAHSAEAAPVLCSSCGEVLSSPHHWPTLVVSYTWLLGAVVYVCLLCLYVCVLSLINLSPIDPSPHTVSLRHLSLSVVNTALQRLWSVSAALVRATACGFTWKVIRKESEKIIPRRFWINTVRISHSC